MQIHYTLTAAEAQILSYISELSARECELSSIINELSLSSKVVECALEGLLVKGFIKKTGERFALSPAQSSNSDI